MPDLTPAAALPREEGSSPSILPTAAPAKKTAAKKTAAKKKSTVPDLKAADVIKSVRRHYGAERDGLGPEWAVLEEFSLAPGAGHQRADLFVVRAWAGRPKSHERHAVEVKVSRADLRNELADLRKSQPFDEVAHRFYLATPAGLVKDTDPIPEHWGRYEITARGACRKVKEATRRPDPQPMPEQALVEAFRRAARSETRIRAAEADLALEHFDDPAAQVVALKASLAAAQRAMYTAQNSATRTKRDLRELLSQIANAGGWLCVCGARMKKDTYSIQHADGSACDQGWNGRGAVDLEGLARRLGLDDNVHG